MVRGDGEAHHLTAFARESGIYRVESRAHVNLYQLFLERSLQLVRHGGRVGLVLPGGVVTDSGAAGLRRHLFACADVDRIAGFDNRRAIFPIHRGVKFVLLTCTAGHPTRALGCRFGLTTAEQLERIEDETLTIPRPLLERLSGADDLGVPELATARDLALVEKISARVPWLGAAEGWQARFGRELNATDDRDRFVPFTGRPGSRPVLEGKQIEPFRATLSTARYELKSGAAAPESPARPRLAYRDVASATNRVTLIAAIVPPRAVTTHTLFCLKSPLPLEAQYVLCALLNSLVANYLIRMRVNTHVTAALVHRLPVPLVAATDPSFARLRSLARALATATTPAEQRPEYAELQALAARLYGLTRDDFARVLETFPLLPEEMKGKALLLFGDAS
jgi:hypothetical protein